jgi:acyl-CoA synthetase (AMP-forming)/AMP-acid ligase II
VFKHLVDLIDQRAVNQADHIAFRFLDAEGGESETITYAQLSFKAKQLADHLLNNDVNEGDRALLIYAPSLEFIVSFFACLYAGVIAVLAYPPILHRHRFNISMARLQSIAVNSQPKVVLTSSKISPLLRFEKMRHSVVKLFSIFKKTLVQTKPWLSLQVMTTDKIPCAKQVENRYPKLTKNSIALLQYTSGSTGDPKGVVLTHENILNNAANIAALDLQGVVKNAICWLPLYHDMGLISGIFLPLFAGIPSTLISPIDFLRAPFIWLKAISQYKYAVTGGPNFCYELCCKKVSDEQVEDLDLQDWQVSFSGAETNWPETFTRFTEKFSPAGFKQAVFFPCYGLAESTLFVTGNAVGQGYTINNALISAGRPFADHHIKIINPETKQQCPSGERGEVWIQGPSVAQGYWNNDLKTKETFANYTQDGKGPFLRSGDLAYIEDDQLYLYGRLKDLIIIRGVSYPPQDIEWIVQASESKLRKGCLAAFSIIKGAEEKLVIMAEINKVNYSGEPEAIYSVIREAVSLNFGLKVYDIVLLKSGTIAKTTSGKIRRLACQAVYGTKARNILASVRSV